MAQLDGRALDDRAAVRRLLDRFGFGPRPGELDAAVGRGFDATVAALLDAAAPAADPGVAATPTPVLDPAADRTAGMRQALTLTGWWLDRMVAARAPLAERMTWFWHGHFATSVRKVRGADLMRRQNDTFRSLGRGTFTALAKALMVDPAMMLWLDAERNTVRAPNENLARECMELFLLGIGHYTEDDVRAVARALTGWTVTRADGAARFVPRRHDDTVKTILGVSRDFDVDSFVDLVLARPESPRFVAGRLWFRLVSAAPPPADVSDRLVAGYGPHRDITGLLRAIAAEPAFRDATMALVKQPVDWLVGLLRAVDLRPGQLPPATARLLLAGLRAMGQVPFQPPSVGGWPADTAWLTTSAALARLHLAQLVAAKANLADVATVAAPARAEAVRRLLGVDAWSGRTAAALAKVTGDPRQLLAVAACAPEYVVSG